MRDELQARTLIVGRIGRLLLGAACIALVIPVCLQTDWELQRVVLVVVGAATAFYAVIHAFILKFFGTVNPWLGAILAVLPAALAFFLGSAQWKTGILTFLGISLLVDGIRREPGCEVMAIPGLVLGEPPGLHRLRRAKERGSGLPLGKRNFG